MRELPVNHLPLEGVGKLRSFRGFVFGGALLCGCAVQRPAMSSSVAPKAEQSILVRSNPADGSTVREPVEAVELHFDPPARLEELTVRGPNGDMPTMVHAVGEVPNYSIPVSGLGSGVYTVSWRATARGREYQGRFGFGVR